MTSPRRVSRIAHRGNSYGWLENTLDAFASAMEIGCDWLELDVRTSRDGHVVVVHDETLWRLWGLGARVAESDIADVRALGFGDERIPLLNEVLELVRGQDVGVLIDSSTPEDTLAAHRVASGVAGVRTMYCGATEAMLALREADPAADLQYKHLAGVLDADLVRALRPSVVNSEWVLATRDHVEHVHQLGCEAWAWTVNDADTMRQLVANGVDGITTDRVRLLAEVLAAPRESTVTAPVPMSADELATSLAVAANLSRWSIAYTRDAPLGQVRTKAHAADFLTSVDMAVERHVREVIAAALPQHIVVGEEEGGVALPGVPTWYLDPVDGTTNLANGIPWTSMSLALAVDDVPLVAAVTQPWSGEVLLAASGQGTTRNGVPVRLDEPTGLRVVLTELMAHEPWPGQVAMLERAAERHVTTRIMGSGTLTLAGIAAGWGQAAIIDRFSPVDHLAALLLVREAGGVVWDDKGASVAFPPPGTPILAAHPAVANEAYALWQGTS